ncbi:hypothetical protein V6N12_009417 [Hibiscus sabdariffa]|uniref:Aminotransferase-like plant mobile domain-containing protein n=1 Tax=Hibiscus sabdariffa TaxID=183260 RepID=A0ABR2ECN3_9ROSI
MIAVNRRSRQRKPANAIQTRSARVSNGNGSRFDILFEDDGEALQVGDQGQTIPMRSPVAPMEKDTILLRNQMEEVSKEVSTGSLGAANILVLEVLSVLIVTSTIPPASSSKKVNDKLPLNQSGIKMVSLGDISTTVPIVKVARDASGSHITLTVPKEKAGKAKVRSMSNRTSQAKRPLSLVINCGISVPTSLISYLMIKVFFWNCQGAASSFVAWRKFLWPYLQSLDPGSDFPWLLGGYFKAILHSEEKFGGSSLGLGFSKSFYDFVHATELFEVAYKSSDFTWKRGMLYKRLDRCFLNEKWRGRQNAFTTLKDDNGTWCSDVEVLKSKAVNFYSQLFTSMGPEIEDYAVMGDFRPLPHLASVDLMRPVIVKEIDAVLWRLWLHRNQLVFYPEYSEGRSIVDLCRVARDDMVRGAATSLPHAPWDVTSDQTVHWQPPPSDWLKRNCDESQITQNGFLAPRLTPVYLYYCSSHLETFGERLGAVSLCCWASL